MFNPLQRLSSLPVASLTLVSVLVAGCDSGSESTPTKVDPIALSAQCLVAAAGATAFSGSMVGGVTAGTAARYNVTAQPSQGSLSYDPVTGNFSYTPTTQARGYRDSFTVEVTGTEDGTAQSTVDIIFGAARIMPLGDSITQGVESSTGTVASDLPTSGNAVGYRQSLLQQLQNAGYLVDFVGHRDSGGNVGLSDTDHSGTPGAQTSAISSGVNAWLSSTPADIVLLHAGTNDINAGGTSAAGIQGILTAINTWSSSASNPTADTVVARIVPSPDATKNGRINSFNASLDGIMSANWPNLTVVDMNAALNAATDMTPPPTDTTGLHPNTAGYQKMADAWFAALTTNNKLNR
ncbi:MAG: GDSL-type esterase/lipase family protein, partial [Pseudomonadota bacterium]